MVEPWATLKRILSEAFGRERPDDDDPEMPGFAPQYDRVFASLTREELYGESGVLLDDDLLGGLFHKSDHFLNFYSEEGANLAFERYGFYRLLRDMGFDPNLQADISNPDEHRLRIHDGEAHPDNLLFELAVGLRELELPDETRCRMLFVNWLLMQNPRQEFPPDRPPLPDQEHPGLGLFPHCAYLLRLMALRLECDGLFNHPSHFHNGALYGRFCKFVDPVVEGRFRALERDLAGLELVDATIAVDEGRVVDEGGVAFEWQPVDHVAPITNRARAWFASDEYRSTVEQTRETNRFRVVG